MKQDLKPIPIFNVEKQKYIMIRSLTNESPGLPRASIKTFLYHAEQFSNSGQCMRKNKTKRLVLINIPKLLPLAYFWKI